MAGHNYRACVHLFPSRYRGSGGVQPNIGQFKYKLLSRFPSRCRVRDGYNERPENDDLKNLLVSIPSPGLGAVQL